MHQLCSLLTSTLALALQLANAAPTAAIETELRIIPLVDSIMWVYASPDGNVYRLKLLHDLSPTETKWCLQNGNMTDHWNAGYYGKTIQYMGSQAPSSLSQNPNIVLLMAGANDTNSNPYISTEGGDPTAAADRLNSSIGQIFDGVPNTEMLLFNEFVPQIVFDRAIAGQHIHLADMSVIQANQTIDGVHPDEAHYQCMGDIWYQDIKGLPSAWIETPSRAGSGS